jgi:CRISPR-associated endonuclease/helicase Cas3
MFFAYSSNDTSKRDWQPLAQHLSEVAKLAALFARPCGCERAARIAGLLHDFGKYNPKFQQLLEGDAIHVEHSIAGAALIPELTKNPRDKVMAEL